MTTKDIKILMMEMDLTVNILAEKWQEPKSTIYALINKKFRSTRLEKKLAKTLGVKWETLMAVGGDNGDNDNNGDK